MELALHIIVGVLITLMSVTTTTAVILAFRDIEGKKMAATTAFVGLCAIGFAWLLYSVVGNGSEGLLVSCGVVSFVLMCMLWLTHVLCAVTAEAGWFGYVALIADALCGAGLTVMFVIGLLNL